MRVSSAVMMETLVKDRSGALRNFQIVSGRDMRPNQLANLYNGVLDPQLEAGMRVTPKQMEARLQRDPEALQIGLIDGWPVSFINLVKLKLEDESQIPITHQRLTQCETFDRTDPDNGNFWFCPWVGVSKDFRGFRSVEDKLPRSLGQLHVLNVRDLALAHGGVFRLFAYSRPGGLNAYLSKLLDTTLAVEAQEKTGGILIRDTQNGEQLITDEIGIKYADADEYLLTIAHYWRRQGEDNRKVDPVFQFHSVNGAMFRPDLVFPFGQIHDGSSLGYRTVLQYPL